MFSASFSSALIRFQAEAANMPDPFFAHAGMTEEALRIQARKQWDAAWKKMYTRNKKRFDLRDRAKAKADGLLPCKLERRKC